MKKLELQALHAYVARCPHIATLERSTLNALIAEILKCWGVLNYYGTSTYHDFYDDQGDKARKALPTDLKEES